LRALCGGKHESGRRPTRGRARTGPDSASGQPFYRGIGFTTGATFKKVFGPTTATVALTDLKITNYFGNSGARDLLFEQASAPAPNTACDGSLRGRALGSYDVQPGSSFNANFVTPLVLSPLLAGDAWCLVVAVTKPSSDTHGFSVVVGVGGYVPSGTFVP
jgi:hypothetical protein